MTRQGRPLESAAKALARRDHSAAGLAARLERQGIDATEAAEAVARLQVAGYVDDERFAAARAAALAERGYGNDAIRADLAGHGLDADRIAAAMEALDAEDDRARELIERHGRSPRTARRLAATGFSPESLASVFDGIPED